MPIGKVLIYNMFAMSVALRDLTYETIFDIMGHATGLIVPSLHIVHRL